MGFDRRHYFRRSIALDEGVPVTVELIGAGSLCGQVVNLSLGGLCARFPVASPVPTVGQLMIVKLGPRRMRVDPQLPCRVAHCQANPEGVFVGLGFLSLPDARQEEQRRRAVAKFVREVYCERLEEWKIRKLGCGP